MDLLSADGHLLELPFRKLCGRSLLEILDEAIIVVTTIIWSAVILMIVERRCETTAGRHDA